MFNLLSTVMNLLQDFSSVSLPLSFELNVTEKQAGSSSGAVTLRSRPDTLIVHGNSTLMIGKDKDSDKLNLAVDDLKGYVREGLGAAHYGSIPVSDPLSKPPCAQPHFQGVETQTLICHDREFQRMLHQACTCSSALLAAKGK